MLLVLLLYRVLGNYSYYVNFGEVKIIFDIPDALEASLFQIDDDNQIVLSGTKQCFLVDRQINIKGQTYILDQNYYDQEDTLPSTDFVIDIALFDSDFVILTQNNILYHITNQSITQIQTLNIDDNELMPQLLSSANYLLIAYADSGYLVNVLDKFTPYKQIPNWKQRSIRYYTQIMNNFIFSAIGNEGLEIYYMLDENIQYMNSIEANTLGLLAIDFRDFSILKFTDKKYLLYVLCKKNGVLVIEMTAIKDQVTFKLLLKYIGPKTEGIAIDLFDEDSVFVAYKANRSYFLIRYRIDGYNKKWSSAIRYNITHKIIDIDVNQYFALVQGVYKHHLIYYTEQWKPLPFLLYGVKQFILVDSFMVGTTSRFVFNFSSLIEPYQIKCYSDSDQSLFEQKYKLMYRTNQSWRQLEFKVYFNKDNSSLSEKLILVMLFTLLSIILVSIIIFYLKRLRTQNLERENLEKKIHSLPQNRASKLIMPHTFRQVTSAEYRVNTYNNTEDTIVQRDRKEQ